MPALSQAQQQFMAICEHSPEKARKKCPNKRVAHEFATTKRRGLPKHVTKSKKSKKIDVDRMQ
jgi:hypothetical protein